ncbi:MAG: hypothetical protein KatS3mg015_1340 [Fimbriimonadales bacterium]|nr:MAG: hypothetical protein KatS3mg015_1340 [Fimbriimonadales bacterium]
MSTDAAQPTKLSAFRRYRGAILFTATVLVVLGLWFGGNYLYAEWSVGSVQFEPLQPGRVNLFGVELAGEQIVVANGIAMLVRGGINEKAKEGEGGEMDTAVGPSIPIKALVGALQGDAERLSELLESLNDLDPASFPPKDVIWEEKDLRAALEWDEALRSKLEYQLGTTLAGAPAPRINLGYLRTGIYVRLEVPVRIKTEGGERTIVGHVRVRYQTRLAQEVLKKPVVGERVEVSNAALYGAVQEVWSEMSKSPEDVRASLLRILSEDRKKRYAAAAEHLLERVTILVTENQIRDANLTEYPDPVRDRNLYSLQLSLTDEGRLRLWQYTRRHGNPQLLFAVDGVAIAAPIVQHEMKYSVAEILNVSDEVDARKAVQVIKGIHDQTPKTANQ